MTATFSWFARHEMRLAARDFLWMVTAGRRARERTAIIGVLMFATFMHGVAWLVLHAITTPATHPDLPALIGITSTMLLSGSAMLSQAMESVTRAFYSRSDLELILSSPAPAARVFAVRIGAIAFSTGAMSLLIAGPFIDVLIWRDGWRWLGAWGALVAIALLATSIAVVLTLTLFRVIGSKRTRFAAQVAAAVIGAAFVIGIQIAAMLSTGTLSRTAFLRSHFVIAHVPAIESTFWWPARAAMGNESCLIVLLTASALLFLLVTIRAAPRFAVYALAANSVAHDSRSISGSVKPFRPGTPSAALRHKEWMLLLRDPWLMSQSLMQLLYLLPPALLLWRSFAYGHHATVICIPVLIMAAGQLAGGLAWLTISGEDAPDLVLSAPITPGRVLQAKIEAVMGAVALIFSPFVIALVIASPLNAIITALGIAGSAASATAIQLWFRSQAKRSYFRRRHTSSRIATFAEAFSSITWAASGAIAAAGSVLAAVTALVALAILLVVRLLAPSGGSRPTSKLAQTA